jgi:exportin-2 (importin alpha re-exporter)
MYVLSALNLCHANLYTCCGSLRQQAQIKTLLTGLMLSTHQLIRAQLSEALSIISSHDFPAEWPTLLPELVERLQTADLATINGVCHTANSILKRYRDKVRTDPLVAELDKTQVCAEASKGRLEPY